MRVGIVGATGQVGGVMRRVLAERAFPVDELRLFASARSAGRTIAWQGTEVIVEDAATADFVGPRHRAVLRRRRHVAGSWPRGWPRPGAVVIDNSSAWRMDPDVPLVVSEVNRARHRRPAQGHHRQPQLHHHGGHAGARPAAPRGRAAVAGGRPPTRPCPAAGWPGVAELDEQVRKVADRAAELTFDGRAVEFPAPDEVPRARSPSTCCPQAGSFVDDGLDETDEEQKLRNETRKILDIPDLPVSGTCVRVPVFTGHSLSINARFDAADHARRARQILADAPGVELADVPTPLLAAGAGPHLRGPDPASTRRSSTGLALFLSNDNLRKGAALNAVQIAELVAAELRAEIPARARSELVEDLRELEAHVRARRLKTRIS